jgi:filamentous hemagglutinin
MSLDRVKAAVEQNPGFSVVYEFPNQKAADAAQAFLIKNNFDNVIKTRVRREP